MCFIVISLILIDLVFAIFFWLYDIGCRHLEEEIAGLRQTLDCYHYTKSQVETKLIEMRIDADDKYVKKRENI